jgi:hypothetical protein
LLDGPHHFPVAVHGQPVVIRRVMDQYVPNLHEKTEIGEMDGAFDQI